MPWQKAELFGKRWRDAPSGALSEAEVREHLDSLLHSSGFRGAPRLQAFLRFVVEHSLKAENDHLKEASVGIAVYGKQPAYDPKIDSTVRVEAAKLRLRLGSYYETEGAQDAIRISIPKGAYVAKIERRRQEGSVISRRWWQAGAIAAGFVGTAWWLWPDAPPREEDPGSLRISRFTAPGSFNSDATVSPDGEFVIYASDREANNTLNLWKQALGGGPAERLTRSSWIHSSPTIGQSGAIVYRTAEEGGALAILEPGKITSRILRNTARARDPRYAPKGQLLAYWTPSDEETRDYGSVYLQNMDDPGSAPVRLFGEFAHASRPIWHDSSTHLLVSGTWRSGVPDREFDAWVVGLTGENPTVMPMKTQLYPTLLAAGLYSSTTDRALIEIGDWRGNWLYLTIPSGEAKDLYRIRLDAKSGRVSGKPQRLTLGSGAVTRPRLTKDGVIFEETETSIDLYSLAEPGALQPAGDLQKHTAETGINFRASVDAAGTGMAWEKRRSAVIDQIWHYSLTDRRSRQLAVTLNRNTSHVLLSPDGRSAAYRVETPGVQPIFLELIGSGQPRKICENCGTPSDWSVDGSHLWYITGGQPARVGLLDLGTGRNGDSLKHLSYSLFGARQRVNSQGDGWLAFYVDNGPRTRQIYIAPLKKYQPGDAESWIAATTGAYWDLSPAWSADGNTLYFVSHRDGFSCIMAQLLDPQTKTPRGAPWAVRHFHDPGQTLMSTRTNRGSDALWVAGGRIYFTLDNTTSGLRILSGLKP